MIFLMMLLCLFFSLACCEDFFFQLLQTRPNALNADLILMLIASFADLLISNSFFFLFCLPAAVILEEAKPVSRSSFIFSDWYFTFFFISDTEIILRQMLIDPLRQSIFYILPLLLLALGKLTLLLFKNDFISSALNLCVLSEANRAHVRRRSGRASLEYFGVSLASHTWGVKT